MGDYNSMATDATDYYLLQFEKNYSSSSFKNILVYKK